MHRPPPSRTATRRPLRAATSRLTQVDPVLILTTAALAAVGVVAVWSATAGPGPQYRHTFLYRQGVFAAIGAVVLVVVAAVDYRKLHDWAWMTYGATTLLLVMVLTRLGTGGDEKGAQAWFNVGPFQLQPSEFAKLSLIGTLAYRLSEFQRQIDLRRVGALLAVSAVPMGLIMLQPDLGLVLVLLTIMLAMLVVGGLPGRYLAILAIGAVVGTVGIVNSPVLKQYQRDRLTVFIDPTNASNSARYNVEQSQLAIASGELTGHGFLQGPQTRLGFVPEQQTDFIFTAIAEQFGFVGGASVIGIYGVLSYRIWRTAQIARDQFGTLICVGVLAMFVFSVFQNVGMAMGIMPVTGIPLLLVSSGGSSTITAFAGIGLVLSVCQHRFR